jgi:hypothetical protein
MQTLLTPSRFVLIFFAASLSFLNAAEVLQPSRPQAFTVRAIVRLSEYTIGQSTPRFTRESDVTFVYSNGWWRLDAVPIAPKPGVFESCMLIPDGTRSIAYPMEPSLTPEGKKPKAQAIACSLLFPSPGGGGGLFDSWLMLCPDPKLPTINSNQIYRLLPIPECETDTLFHTNNIGEYTIEWSNSFVSRLLVRNVGYEVEFLPSAMGFQSKFRRLGSPWMQGYTEFEYALLSTTNYQGVKFPASAVIKRMMPTFNRQLPAEMFVRVLTEINVVSISGLKTVASNESIYPKEFVVADMRLPDGASGSLITYRASDSEWKSISDMQLDNLNKSISKGGLQNGFSKFILTLLLLPSLFLLFFCRNLWNVSKIVR